MRLMRAPEAQAKLKLFGTDGVRGTANVWPMTAEVAMQLGRALAFLCLLYTSPSPRDS